MATCEAAIHGDCARHVGVVVRVGGTDIEQHELAVFELRAVFAVVEAARVFARGDDGIVGEAPTSTDEFMGELGFDIGFGASGFGEAEDALEALCREIAGVLDDCDFARTFYEPELVEQGS